MGDDVGSVLASVVGVAVVGSVVGAVQHLLIMISHRKYITYGMPREYSQELQ